MLHILRPVKRYICLVKCVKSTSKFTSNFINDVKFSGCIQILFYPSICHWSDNHNRPSVSKMFTFILLYDSERFCNIVYMHLHVRRFCALICHVTQSDSWRQGLRLLKAPLHYVSLASPCTSLRHSEPKLKRVSIFEVFNSLNPQHKISLNVPFPMAGEPDKWTLIYASVSLLFKMRSGIRVNKNISWQHENKAASTGSRR